ncbi:UNVERIFIED_CONTAM: hypothetical protein FKN15_014187 [Acipenser sinensis]
MPCLLHALETEGSCGRRQLLHNALAAACTGDRGLLWEKTASSQCPGCCMHWRQRAPVGEDSFFTMPWLLHALETEGSCGRRQLLHNALAATCTGDRGLLWEKTASSQCPGCCMHWRQRAPVGEDSFFTMPWLLHALETEGSCGRRQLLHNALAAACTGDRGLLWEKTASSQCPGCCMHWRQRAPVGEDSFFTMPWLLHALETEGSCGRRQLLHNALAAACTGDRGLLWEKTASSQCPGCCMHWRQRAPVGEDSFFTMPWLLHALETEGSCGRRQLLHNALAAACTGDRGLLWEKTASSQCPGCCMHWRQRAPVGEDSFFTMPCLLHALETEGSCGRRQLLHNALGFRSLKSSCAGVTGSGECLEAQCLVPTLWEQSDYGPCLRLLLLIQHMAVLCTGRVNC